MHQHQHQHHQGGGGGKETKSHSSTLAHFNHLQHPFIIKGGATRSRFDRRDYRAEDVFHEQRLAGSPSSPFVGAQLPSELFLFDADNTGYSSSSSSISSSTTNGSGPDGGNLGVNLGGNGVYNQGASYKCVAYVVSTIREKQVYDESRSALSNLATSGSGSDNNNNNNGLIVDKVCFSKDYLYEKRTTAPSNGMSGIDAMELTAKYGMIEEDKYYQCANLMEEIRKLGHNGVDDPLIRRKKQDLADLTYKFKRDGAADVYAKVDTVQGLKESLYHNGPCLIILPFFGNTHVANFWRPPITNDVEEMGHAVTVVGYSDVHRSFYLRNTWGPEWNQLGHVWFPYSDFVLAWEAWTIFPKGTDHLVYHQKRAGSGQPQQQLPFPLPLQQSYSIPSSTITADYDTNLSPWSSLDTNNNNNSNFRGIAGAGSYNEEKDSGKSSDPDCKSAVKLVGNLFNDPKFVHNVKTILRRLFQ